MGLSVLGFDQAGVDRCGEARIVQLDGEVFALRLAGGLLPGRAELGSAGEDAEVGAALAVALAGDELGLDVDELSPSTRASMDGQVPEDLTYAEWLSRQSPERLEQVLGVTKAQMYLDGGRSVEGIERFFNDGRLLTLKELESRD